MLELRPNCELCDKDLPPASPEARICTYECTFCATCVEEVLQNVCPNCGGGFSVRPVRPVEARREGVSLGHHPASTKRVQARFSREEIEAFVSGIKDIDPSRR